jgi:hypothetical protein
MKVVDFPTDFAMAKTDSIEIVHRDLWWEVFTVGKDLDPAIESRTLCNSSRERLARYGHLMGIKFSTSRNNKILGVKLTARCLGGLSTSILVASKIQLL